MYIKTCGRLLLCRGLFFICPKFERGENMEKQKELALEARREYYREWRKNNKEKVAEYNRNYWLKKAKEKEEVK